MIVDDPLGRAIGSRLLATGARLILYDLENGSDAEAFTAAGATITHSGEDAARQADAVLVNLLSNERVATVIFGPNGVAASAPANTLIIDLSSTSPEATQGFAEKANRHGLRWVDCPSSGSVEQALAGKLTFLQGGLAKDVKTAQSILANAAGNQTHMRPVGAGQATKLINQVLCGIGFMAVAEATALAEGSGVDTSKIPQALKGGRADSAILQEYMPRFANRDYRRTSRIDHMVQDLDNVEVLRRRTGTAMPLTAVAGEIHRMLTAAGLGGEDQAALMEYFKGPDTSKFK